MTGLVVVSHSTGVVEGVAEVTAQMGGGNARIVPAGDDEDGIGTSPDCIHEGIEEADDGDGVTVFVDLGGTVMSVEFAIETTMDSETIIADMPVLGGTLSAAVGTTSKKATLDSIVECAENVRDYRKLNWSVLNRPN